MIGNDLVDLHQAALDNNWQRKGFLHKVFTSPEQQLIQEAASPNYMVWLLWSMKEASYKIVNRTKGFRSYNPTSFCCISLTNDRGDTSGIVSYGKNKFFIRSFYGVDFIHSIAVVSQQDFEHIHSHLLPNRPDYVEAFNSALPDYVIRKSTTGIPQMLHRSNHTTHAASISHHGRHLAIIYSDVPLSGD